MKKIIVRISAWAVVVLLVALSGCSKGDDDAKKVPPGIEDDPYAIGSGAFTITLPHYLLCFFEPGSFGVSVNSDKRLISVDFKIEYHTPQYDFRHAEDSDRYPEQAGIYELLCERYKDISYSREQRMMPYWNGRRYPVNNIVSIAVVSDADYDSDHPAGSSLADICEVLTASPRDYIASGYTDTYDWTEDLETLSPIFGEEIPGWGVKAVKPIYKRLDKCWAEDLVLAGYYPSFFTLRILQAPAADFKGRFTITLLDEKGKTFILETGPVSWAI